jgi:hypothetical protein
MFSVGQRVWHRDGQRSGTVLECAGDRVYIEQDNGAELDFRASDLTATPPAHTTSSPAPMQVSRTMIGRKGDSRGMDSREAHKPPATAFHNRILIAADITPEHERVLSKVPVRTVQAVAALFERKPGAGKFSALDVAGKLNVIAEITDVPYLRMREYSDRPGELGLMMGKGLADRRGTS